MFYVVYQVFAAILLTPVDVFRTCYKLSTVDSRNLFCIILVEL